MPAPYRMVCAPDWSKIVGAANRHGFEPDVAMVIDETRSGELIAAANRSEELAQQLARMTAVAAFHVHRDTLSPDWEKWTTEKAVEFVREVAAGKRDDMLEAYDLATLNEFREATGCQAPATPSPEPPR